MQPILTVATESDPTINAIRGYISVVGSSQRFLLGTLSLTIARHHPEVFEAWKDCLVLTARLMTEKSGGKIGKIVEISDADLN